MANDGIHETHMKRVAEGSQAENVKTIPRVIVFFQKFAGTFGEAADRGIKDVEFKVFHNGKEVPDAAGKTDERGAVELDVPADLKVELEIFGTRYAIRKISPETTKDKPRKDIPDIGDGSGIKGVERRLQMLGYEPGTVDGKASFALDLAIANFEQDNELHPVGFSPEIGKKDGGAVARHGVAQVGNGKKTIDKLLELEKSAV